MKSEGLVFTWALETVSPMTGASILYVTLNRSF